MQSLPTVWSAGLFVALLAMSGCRTGDTTAEVKKLATKVLAPELVKQLAQVGLNAEQLRLVHGWVGKARGKHSNNINYLDFRPEVDIITVMEEAGFAGRVDIIEILAAANPLGAREFISEATEQAALAGDEEAVDQLLSLYEDDIDVDKVILAAARGNHLSLVESMSTKSKSEPDDNVWMELAREAGFNNSTSMLDLAKQKGDNCYGGLSGCAVDGAVKGGNLHIVKKEFPEIDNSTYPNDDPIDYYMHMAAAYGHPNILAYLIELKGDMPLSLVQKAARNGHVNVLKFLSEAGIFNISNNDEHYQDKIDDLFLSLYSAAYNGQLSAVDYVFDHISSLNIDDGIFFSLRAASIIATPPASATTDTFDEMDMDDLDHIIDFLEPLIHIEKAPMVALIGAAQGDQIHIVEDMITRLINDSQVERASELSELPIYLEKALLEATRHGSNKTVHYILRNYAVQVSDVEIYQEVLTLASDVARWNIVSYVENYIDNIEKWSKRIKDFIKLNTPITILLDQINSVIIARQYQLSTQDADLLLNYAVKKGSKYSIGELTEVSIELIEVAIELGAKDFDTALSLAEAAGHVEIIARLKQAKAADLAKELKREDMPKI